MIKPISKGKLKLFRQLQQKKFRKEHGLFVISGLRAVQEALTAAHLTVRFVLVQNDRLNLMNELPRFTCEAIFTLSEQEFKQVVEEKTPQGVALVVEKPVAPNEVAEFSSKVLFLERISDPGNLGTLLRGAAWFGWQTVLLSKNAVDPFAPKTVRASAGTIAHLHLLENIELDFIKHLKAKHNYQLVVGTLNQGRKLPEVVLPAHQKLILALGSEAHGLSPELLELADLRVTIPRPGRGESLNLAMAGSIFLYHFTFVQGR